MPPFSTLATTLDAAAGLPAIVLAIVAAALLVIIADWRASLFMMQIFYLALALASLRLLPAEWAILCLLVGALIGIMWYLSAYPINRERGRRNQVIAVATATQDRPAVRAKLLPRWPWLATSTTFRSVTVIMVGLGIFLTRAGVALPGLSAEADFLCLWLTAMGLLALALDEEPFKAGMGLLMWLAAVQIFYGNLTHDARMIGVIGALELLVGLACAYLMVARATLIGAAPEQESRP